MANNQILASDNFASGSLAAGWGTWSGATAKCAITGSAPYYAEPAAITNTYGQLWTGLTWGNDQISEVIVETLNSTGTNTLILVVRYVNPGGGNQGYQAQIANAAGTTSAKIFKVVAGTATQLVSTTGLTFASGDIWTFAAIGSCLAVYQNFNRVAYIGDATIASGGSPGFGLVATSGVVDCQISSWRGYNSQQQDGIWTKQGCVLPATATELSASPSGNVGFLGVSYGAARILSGNVYRGYFTYGTSINYAESSDGQNWTPYSSNPLSTLAGYSGVDVYFYSGTYYLWAQATQGHSTATLFTSTDGLTWTNKGNTNLPSGSGYYYGLHIADVIGGSFYGLFSYLGGATPVTYLATSPASDGLTWTIQNSSNPVISGTFCGFQIVKANGKYYFWATQNQVGQGSSEPTFDPFEAVRWSSPDLVHWTAGSHSVHRFLLSDSVNNVNGGVAPTSIINVGNNAYMYYQGSPSDAVSPQVYQTMLAVAPTTIANLVNQSEDGTVQTATDNFSYGAGNLNGNWTTPTGGTALMVVSGPYVEPTTTAGVCSAVYTGAAFSQNQYSEVTLQTLSGTLNTSFIMPAVWAQTSAFTDYEGFVASPTATSDAAASIRRRVAGANTQIGPTAVCEPQVGDVWRLSIVVGSDGFPVLTLFQNGFTILQVQDTNPLSVGNPGMCAYSSVAIADAQISLFAAGNANVIPPYPPPGPGGIGWSPVDSRQAVPGFGPGANTGIVDEQGNVIYSAQNPPFSGNSQVSDNSIIPPIDSRITKPTDSRSNIPVNSRVAPPFGEQGEP